MSCSSVISMQPSHKKWNRTENFQVNSKMKSIQIRPNMLLSTQSFSKSPPLFKALVYKSLSPTTNFLYFFRKRFRVPHGNPYFWYSFCTFITNSAKSGGNSVLFVTYKLGAILNFNRPKVGIFRTVHLRTTILMELYRRGSKSTIWIYTRKVASSQLLLTNFRCCWIS